MAAARAPLPGARVAWWALAIVAGALVALAVAQWVGALLSARPVLYGEGAVANAALLLRAGSPYREMPDAFVAANYPPLFFAVASVADPFVVGRAISLMSVVAVAGLIAWRALVAMPPCQQQVPAARINAPLRRLVAAALALTWLATTPVTIWAAAVKPDLLALALTVFAVVLLDTRPLARIAAAAPFAGGRPSGPLGAVADRCAIAGALLAAAAWSKPTALIPAVAVGAWLLVTDRRALLRVTVGAAAVTVLALVHAASLGLEDVWRHVVLFNALPWSADQAALLLLLGAATVGISVAAAVLVRAPRGVVLGYGVGALVVVLLGGREGATINYLLDLTAATSLALASVADRLRISAAYPVAAVTQLVLATYVVAPFGIVPGREPSTGAWGSADRGPLVAALASEGPLLVEDSGLLVGSDARPVVDDLFLWSRLVEQRTIEAAPVVIAVRAGHFVAVVSEADLEHLDAAPAYQRARWHPQLVAAVFERYRLERATGTLWIYRPR